MADSLVAWPRLVCPACRRPPVNWPLDDVLVCSNSACGMRYSLVSPGIPSVVSPAGRGYAESFNVAGRLPPEGNLAGWLADVEPGTARFNAISRAAIFLKALADSDRESFYRDLCDALLAGAERYETVVDLGCGLGNLAMEIAERVPGRVTGLDLDADLLRWAGRAATGERFEAPVRVNASDFAVLPMFVRRGPNRSPLRFICTNLLDPPFEPGSFDLVTLVNVLDSVPYPAVALRQAVALAKPGGHLLFASPDSWNVGATPPQRWLASTEAGWDRVFAREGLETIRRIDDLEWRLQDSPRLHHLYRVHGRLLKKREE